MIKTIKNAWKVQELRGKMLYTVLMIVVFRIGSCIPVPFLDTTALSKMMGASGLDTGVGAFFKFSDAISGGSFQKATIFAMGVNPYITSSIVMQLITVAIPALERLSKEGEEGRKKVAALTRYVTILLGIIQGFGLYWFLNQNNVVTITGGPIGIFVAVVIIATFTAGTALMMWFGEQINKKGVGNGISILLFAGIVSRMPKLVHDLVRITKEAVENPESAGVGFVLAPIFIILFVAIVWVVVFMNDAERKIPVQYAKRVIGRKMYGGQSTHIPIKVGLTGVMPIIFAGTILQVPGMIKNWFFPDLQEGFWASFFNFFSQQSWWYMLMYFVLILAFAFFYMSIQYNPIEMSNNLRQSNGTIPGLRPGKPTSDFLSKILSKITLTGALFLSVLALLPMILPKINDKFIMFQVQGTSVIILVGVALETVKQLESQMMMKHYKGFLD